VERRRSGLPCDGGDPGDRGAWERVSTVADQRAIGITIYNSDLALVRDRRQVNLPAGESHLAIRDVSGRLEPETALLTSVGRPHRISVLEQNFDYDLLSPGKLLEKYVGRDVNVIHDEAGSGKRYTERARVLAINGGIVLKYSDRIETPDNADISFPSLPPNLRDEPTLVSDLTNAVTGPQIVELAYLTGGLDWHADYTALLDPTDDHLDLRGWITLQNQSGTTYRNADVQLVAGDVHIVRNIVKPGTSVDSYSIGAVAKKKPQQEGLLEYHLYTLPRRTTVANNQTKQVALLSAARVPVVKTLELDGSDYYYRNWSMRSDLGSHLKVGTFVTFKNAGGDLGIPLPSGTIRVYKRDDAGNAQFVGSDDIDHTPKNETVRLKLGSSFDVTASKKQTDFHVVDSVTFESAYEIILSNAHKTPETVLVVEPIPADWTMLQTSIPFQKTSSSTASWNVRVPAEGSATLTYRVRVAF